MEYVTIQKLLTDHLKTLPDLPKLIEENDAGYLQSDEQVSTKKVTYVRTTLQPLRSFPNSIGIGGDDVYPVRFLIQLFVPAGSGTDRTTAFADDVIKLFARGRNLIIDDVCVDTTRAYKNPNNITTNYTLSTVVIEAQSFITRP